ncbi:hypothetical protein BDZ89DRAFT_1074499 [Hymenopellis radicata]|nr:hypothetical protein BDZ89DRAFT_1074499 [Hymenopellis radicata]
MPRCVYAVDTPSSNSGYGTASPPPSYPSSIRSSDELLPLVSKDVPRKKKNGFQICLWIFLLIFLAIACIYLYIDLWLKEDAMRRDEEHRKHSRLVWLDLKPDHRCLSFESRRYTAELANIPVQPDVDELEWRCVRDEGKIIAEWITHTNEPTCRTYWDQHVKKECTGYHKRIVEAKLENHQWPWDNWEDMCYSTPSHFNFAHYDHPDICIEMGHNGIFGRWFVSDNDCP